MERLQKILAEAGIASRRKAEQLISTGHVKVNGRVVTELGTKVTGKEEILVDDVKVNREEKVYYLLNKPRGVVTTVLDEKNRKTVVDLIDTNKRIYPVGRLDYNTTGALLLTNDGDFAQSMMHPSCEVEKVYLAKVKGILKGEHIVALKNGVMIDGKKTLPCKAKLRKVDLKNHTSMVELSIHEGHNHQVKKMIEAIGFEVEKLTRLRFGFLDVKKLKSGEYRPLTPKEVSQFYALSHRTK